MEAYRKDTSMMKIGKKALAYQIRIIKSIYTILIESYYWAAIVYD